MNKQEEIYFRAILIAYKTEKGQYYAYIKIGDVSFQTFRISDLKYDYLKKLRKEKDQ